MKTQAVENFLSSMDMNMRIVDHYANAIRDARLYQWYSATRIAIMTGIEEKYKAKVKNQGGE